MILQALKDYYDRKGNLPRVGWQEKEIPFILVLDPEGLPVEIENTVEGSGKQKKAKSFLVPSGVKKTANVLPNAFWENIEYALGYPLKGKPERVAEQHRSFISLIEGLNLSGNPSVSVLMKFLKRPDKVELVQMRFPDRWREILETPGTNLTFRKVGEKNLIVNDPEVSSAIDQKASTEEAATGSCLVSGKPGEPIASLHPAIKGVWGAQSSGANIVSFNLPAFSSYGKEQGFNAPVSKRAAFSYSTALNHLLEKDSRRRVQVGDSSMVFWADRETPFEDMMDGFFSEPPKDDPDRNTQAVRALHEAVAKGVFTVSDSATRFFVLGLAPNAARISIRFWKIGTVPEMANRIDAHFQDLEIVHGSKDRPGFSLFRLLASTAVQGKAENIGPNLGGEMMRAILDGTPYPRTLLHATLRRIKAEHEVTYPRAALLKACLNRLLRFSDQKTEKEIKMSLDLANSNIGYRLGRLFALLEKIQGEAQGSTNSTIRDRFYGAASGTPITVFGNLMRLKNHHLSKLPDGLRITRERQLQEVVSGIPSAGFPSHLSMGDQGRFAIGYYHQMQFFYSKKPDSTESEKE